MARLDRAARKAREEREAAQRADIESRFPDCMGCGAPFALFARRWSGGSGIPGYGWSPDMTRRLCYACCGEDERARMVRDGRATLYLSGDLRNGRGVITDWPGTLRFPATVYRMRHPFAREAWLAYFTGPDGRPWSARNIGDSQIAHARRIKGRA